VTQHLKDSDSVQVISVDQGVMPLTDVYGNPASNDLAVQLLQGGDIQGGDIQLQGAGQQALLTGVDSGSSGVINKPVQLDASLLQQGNAKLCINEKVDLYSTVKSTSPPEPVVPNVVIKSDVDSELMVIQSACGNEAAILEGIGTTVVGENLLERFQPQTSSSDHKLMSTSYADTDNVAGFDCIDTSIMLGQKIMSSSSTAEHEQHEELQNHVCEVRSIVV